MNSLKIKRFVFASIISIITCTSFAGEDCNGYNYLKCDSGVPGHRSWSGHIDLKEMRWDFKHPLGGHVYGSVNDIICTDTKISYQTFDELQGVTNNCFGTIASTKASGKCNTNGFFTCKLLKQ